MDNTNYCRCRQTTGCYATVLAIIGILLSFVIGVIVGVMNASVIVEAMPAVIAIAILLGVMFLVFLILKLCNRR